MRLSALLAPALAIVVFAATHPGTPEQALAICQAAARQYAGLTCDPLPHAIGGLTPATQSSFVDVIRAAWHASSIYWSLALTLAYLALLFMATRSSFGLTSRGMPAIRARDTFAVAAIVLLPTIPLYFVGADYGRWLSTTTLVAVLVLTNQWVMLSVMEWGRSVSRLSRRVDARQAERAIDRPAVMRVLMLTTVVMTPFLFLAHYPPSFLIVRMISARTLRLDDLGQIVSRFTS